MRLKDHLEEMAILKTADWNENSKMMDDCVDNIKKFNLWNEDVVWRGFNTDKKMSAFADRVVKVITDREKWRGFSTPAKQVIDALGLETTPIFVTMDMGQAMFFGGPRVFVPNDNFKTYYHPEIHDLKTYMDTEKTFYKDATGQYVSDAKTNKDPVAVAKEYTFLINKFPKITQKHHEIMVSTESYYLIYPAQMLTITRSSRFAKIKKSDQIQKYKDIVQMYNDYTSYLRWHARMRAKNDPFILKQYLSTSHYPKEWFEDLV